MAYCTGCGSELPNDARFCPTCGTATPSMAGAGDRNDGPAPPTPTPTPAAINPTPLGSGGGGAMRFVLPAIIAIAIVVIAIVYFTQRDGARPVAGDRTETATSDTRDTETPVTATETSRDRSDARPSSDATETSAASLDSAFFNDPQGAAKRYPGPVRVTGVIATMVTPGATPSLSLEGRTRFNYMVVTFPDGYRERLALLMKGQTISVACGTVRSLGGTTILGDCALD